MKDNHMKELYIIRHGEAGDPFADWQLDEKRPLTEEGKQIMKEVAKALQKMKVHFDEMLTSPLIRALQTAECIKSCCKKDLTITDLLKPGSSCEALIRALNELKGCKTVAIVGHEPFLSTFASYCLTKQTYSLLDLKKGGVVCLEIDGPIIAGQCTLKSLQTPTQMIQHA